MRFKKALYITLVLLFILPLAQNAFHLFELRDLEGDFSENEVLVPQINIDNYKSGSFQKVFEEYWNEGFGLRNLLIRINNHFNYSFFDVTTANDVIVGKDEMLFPESYIKSYYGEDFIGREKIRTLVKKAKLVQDSLDQRNKLFFLMICPGKAFIYPENIPEKYEKLYHSEHSNYEVLINEAKKEGLRLLNLTAYIQQNKENFDYLVFPKQGVHWSGNTVAYVADTLLKYISDESGRNIVKLKLKAGNETIDDYRYTDYDIGEAMNLLWNIADETLHYPKINFNDKPKDPPTLLGVGDSFFQSFYGFYPIIDSAFSKKSQVWYYNKVIDWPLNLRDLSIKTKWLDLDYELSKSDVIILEMTDENIKYEGFNFIDNLEKLLKGSYRIKEEMLPLYNDLMSQDKIVSQAKNLHEVLGYTEEQMRSSLVRNIINNQWLLDFDYDTEVKNMIQYIKTDEKWLNSIKEKAIKNNVPLEEAIKNDAIWSVNQKLSQN